MLSDRQFEVDEHIARNGKETETDQTIVETVKSAGLLLFLEKADHFVT